MSELERKETISSKLNEVKIMYEGTEMLDLEKLALLTRGRGIELHCDGDGVRLTLMLEFTSSDVMEGRFQLEVKK